MAGRPKEFDKQEALAQAMDVFWTHGYDATSVQDLLDAMGINRGSMYDTFGDKHALFTAAYDHYAQNAAARITRILDGPGSPLANIRKLLRCMADPAGDGRRRGCMCTNAVVELAPHDAQVAGAVKNTLGFLARARNKLKVLGLPGDHKQPGNRWSLPSPQLP